MYKKPGIRIPARRCGLALASLVAGGFVLSAPAQAQQTTTSYSSQWNVPYGHAYRDENAPYVASTRDANGNRVIINGEILQNGSTLPGTMADQYLLNQYGYGANTNSSTYTGAGSIGAIGNQLNVVTVGNWNTVIIDNNQVNNGNQTVNLNSQELNGEINLND